MSPKRRIRRSTGPLACWKDRSKYGRDARRSTSSPRPATGASRPAAGSSPAPGRCPSTAASSGSSVSSSRRSPRSLPYDVEFSLTRTSSRTPCSASQRASVSTSAGRRDTNEPRKDGIAQNVQRRSQPEASLSGATGPLPSRRRSDRGPEAGATPAGRSGRSTAPWPGTAGPGLPVDRRQRQQVAAVARDVRHVRARRRGSRPQAGGDVGVVVEAEHRVGLGQRRGELLAVPLGEAADRDHGLGAPGALEVGGLQDGVDRVLLGRLDEAAGVDDGDVGVARVLDERPAVGGQPAGQLLGVDLVARAAERHQRDAAPRGGQGSGTAPRTRWHVIDRRSAPARCSP